MASLFLFFGGLPEYVAGYSRPLSIPPTSPREPEWSLFGTPPKPLPQPTSARGSLPQVPQWHPRVAKRSSDRSSARRPCPQVLQRHPRVAKRASIGTLAREPSTEALLGQGRVAKGRKSVPLPGLWSGSRPGSAWHPRLQVVLRYPRVAKYLPSNLKSVSLFYPCRSSARHPFHRYLRDIPAWRTASRPVHDRQLTDALTGLRHGDPAHRCLSGILAEPL